MSHLVCPLCGKYAPLSTLNPDQLDLDIKVVSFRGLGRGRGFAKGEAYSILGDDEITPIIADKIEKLYYMLIDHKILLKTVNDFTINLMNDNNKLRKQLANKDSKIYSLDKENREKDKEIEENELRRHTDYIIFESLSLDESAKLKFVEDNYYMVITPITAALYLYLFLLMQELPNRLKRKILQHVDVGNYPIILQILNRAETRWTVAEELFGEKIIPYNPSGVVPYTLSFDELKKIVNRVKEKLSNPDEIIRELNLKNEKLPKDWFKRLIKNL
ncbi:MAG: hypothetical protein MUO21_04595 [Nitrososphaeraceae archaeon]|nr:hypothetical protein [Nitrososphaeraceae archaeon]